MSSPRFLQSCIVSAALVALSGCMSGPESDREDAVEEVADSYESFEAFEATVYREPDTGVYIVDGDTPIMSRDELRAFYEEHVREGALSVNTVDGEPVYWNDQQKLNLTYCVSTKFGAQHEAVKTAMLRATKAWQLMANVRFIHVASQDGQCTRDNPNVLFDVGPIPTAVYIARAFFPGDAREGRNVRINASIAFDPSQLGPYTLAGVLRHELGHTLGFRHEHTRPEAGVCFEDDNWEALTAYDSESVMHYPHCNGDQDGDLVITALDGQGARKLYGAPKRRY